MTVPVASAGSVGDVLHLVRTNGGLTRAEIMEYTGLARSTVAQRLHSLVSLGLVGPAGAASTKGRPASRFVFLPQAGSLLIADMGATGVRVAATDLDGRILAEEQRSLDIASGPRPCLELIDALFDDVLGATGQSPKNVLGIGVGVPGPVDFEAGCVVNPPIMRGWDGYDIPAWFAPRFACPVKVEKDANAMAVGEHRLAHPEVDALLMLKISTGVGSGIIAGGRLYRGHDGAAGDIGHLPLRVEGAAPPPLCRCGQVGCIEAYAGGWALVRDLREAGLPVSSVDDIVELVRAGDPQAIASVRRAGRIIGDGLSDAVSLLNPEVVVLGGSLALAENHLFAGVRESVYRRSLPLATRRLRIVGASQGLRSGVAGLVATLNDYLLEPARVDRLVAETL